MRKLIGIVSEGKKFTIYDHTGKIPMLIGNITKNFGVHWNDYVELTTPQRKYLVDEVKKLKGNIM